MKLYPKRNIGDTWSELKNNLAFNINASTLENSTLKKNVIIEALAEQMGTSTHLHINLQQYKSLGTAQCFDPARLRVLSYHNKQGAVLDTATHFVAGVETLQNLANRPQGIHFVKLKSTFDFTSLNIGPASSTNIDYYASLPLTPSISTEVEGVDYPSPAQMTAFDNTVNTSFADLQTALTAVPQNQPQVEALRLALVIATNERNINRQRRDNTINLIALRANSVNFNGATDWLQNQANSDTLKAYLNQTASPFLLSEPAFDSNIAAMNTKKFISKFDELIIETAYEPLKQVIFGHVCPNLSNEPFQLFKSVCQESRDPKTSTITKLSVQQYYDIFNSLLRSLPSMVEWQVDVHEYFISNMSPQLREVLEHDGYTAHQATQSKQPFEQMQLIENARKKALLAEKSVSNQKRMIQDQLSSNHGFFTNSNGEKMFYSPADDTIRHYKEGEDSQPREVKCWGCGGNGHRWYDSVRKMVVCPYGSNPSYIQKAAEERNKLRQLQISRGQFDVPDRVHGLFHGSIIVRDT